MCYGMGDATAYVSVVKDWVGNIGFAKKIVVNDNDWEQDAITQEDYIRLKKRMEFEFKELISRMDYAFNKGMREFEGDIFCNCIESHKRWKH